MSTFASSKTIFDLKSGQIDHLLMQKFLYLSHMVHLGVYGERLVTGNFEAWAYGPVEPNLYQKLRAYGSSNIADIFPEEPYEEDSKEYNSIKLIMDKLGNATSRRLVAITHQKDGAWSRCYQPGIRGIVIPDAFIRKEFDGRVRRAD